MLHLTREGMKNREEWEKIGVKLPSYDVGAAQDLAKHSPRWVHFGIGNIFRIFIGGIADDLLESGALDRGITCVESFDYDIVDKIYKPFDNLSLSVVLNEDGTREYRVVGALAEAVKARSGDARDWARLKEIFSSKDLQMVTFTITEKGYALRNTQGSYFPFIRDDIDNGPEKAASAPAIVTAMLYTRYRNGELPLALVSLDNCSHNGEKLRSSVLTMASEWKAKGYVDEGFLAYVSDEDTVAFPWTMIDKITPRPGESIAADLERIGIVDMQPVITSKRTYIAPFANAEKAQYLVIEDHFPNGRPALDQGYHVYLTDRKTVNLCERMKVTACLNPVHSALGPIGVVLGEEYFAHMLGAEPDLMAMAKMVEREGLKMVEDPVILSPEKFAEELFASRFTNEYLGDTNLRLAVDVSQMVGIRFGETIKAYMARYGSAGQLTAIPLGIAGWLRYMLAVDDAGNRFELAPDPMNEVFTEAFRGIEVGSPETCRDQLRSFLSNPELFAVDLYQSGAGQKVEAMFREMIQGPGAVKETIHRYMS